MRLNHARKQAGMTLTEVLISAVIISLAMGTLLTGSIALQRSFAASTQFAIAQSNQTRAIDYLTRDIRRSITMTSPSASVPVSLTIPSYYTAGVPRDPVRVGSGVGYGNNPITINYKLENGNLIREEDGVQQVIAEGISECSTVLGADGVATVKVSFTPRFRLPNLLPSELATEMVATVAPNSSVN